LKLHELIINSAARSLVMLIPVGSCILRTLYRSDYRILYIYGSHFQSEFSKSKVQKDAFNQFISTFSGIPDILPVILVVGKSYVCCLCFGVWITSDTCIVDFILGIHIKIHWRLLHCRLLLSATVGTCTWSSVFWGSCCYVLLCMLKTDIFSVSDFAKKMCEVSKYINFF